MAVQNVANNPLGSYPVLVDRNTANAEMQVLRLDVGVGTTESRVSSSNPLPVTGSVTSATSTTTTRSQVADNAADVLILASNTSRKGASIQNDSSAVLYLGLGTTTVSATNYSARMVQYAYFEVPFNFTGEIRGIWASDPADGAARITEFT